MLVRIQYALPERPLVETLPESAGDVPPAPDICVVVHHSPGRRSPDVRRIVDDHSECETSGVVADDEHRPCGHVFPGNQPVDIDQRQTLSERESQAPVVGMIRILAPIPVTQEAIRVEAVVIFDSGRGSD